MEEHYDGTKLLSLMDINGQKPEIYISTLNRTAGKTTYFSRLLVKRFLEGKGKFALINRHVNELEGTSEKFFRDIQGLFFRGHEMTEQMSKDESFLELFLDNKSCGYAIPLKKATKIKKVSHLLSDVERMFFDEFQDEDNLYLKGEVEKLISVHTSIARGGGKAVRYVPLYMASNTVTMLNPYFTELGISERLKADTRFLKGDGFVLETGFLESVAKAQKGSGFNRAFAKNKYVDYAAQNVYLHDSKSFIEKPYGKFRYVATLKFKGTLYSIKEFPENGWLYCDTRVDATFPKRICVTTDDHTVNYVMLKNNDLLIRSFKYYFDKGCFRFQDIKCKSAIMAMLSY